MVNSGPKVAVGGKNQTTAKERADRNIEVLERFWEALRVGDASMLDEICTPDFRLVEPDLFDVPFRTFADYRANVAASGPRGEFAILDIDPIGDSLLVHSTWTPPAGGSTTEHRVIWSFWDGKVSRIDGKCIG